MKAAENSRIQKIYNDRDLNISKEKYSKLNPDNLFTNFYFNSLFSSFFSKAFPGKPLDDLKILDFGCGDGSFLVNLLYLGFNPANIYGYDVLENRISKASLVLPSSVSLTSNPKVFEQYSNFDIIFLNLVYSSVLSDDSRIDMSKSVDSKLKENCFVIINDFRYNNPLNCDVRKITCRELKLLFKDYYQVHYKTFLLIPQLSRILHSLSPLFAYFVNVCCPFLRSHFFFTARKSYHVESST